MVLNYPKWQLCGRDRQPSFLKKGNNFTYVCPWLLVYQFQTKKFHRTQAVECLQLQDPHVFLNKLPKFGTFHSSSLMRFLVGYWQRGWRGKTFWRQCAGVPSQGHDWKDKTKNNSRVKICNLISILRCNKQMRSSKNNKKSLKLEILEPRMNFGLRQVKSQWTKRSGSETRKP